MDLFPTNPLEFRKGCMTSPQKTNSSPFEIVKPTGSLRNSFLLALLPISITFILLLGGLTYLRARNVISNLVNSQINAILDSLELDFISWLNTRRIRLDLAVRQPDLKAALERTLESPEILVPSDVSTREIILSQLQKVAQRSEGLLFNDFIITTPDGTIIIATQQSWEGENISSLDFYKALFTNTGSMAVYGQPPIGNRDMVIITSVPYFNDRNSLEATIFGLSGSISMIGLLEDANRFNPFAQSYLITLSRDFFRVDPHQKTITRQEPSSGQSTIILPEIVRYSVGLDSDSDEFITATSFDGTSVIANYTWISDLKTALVVEIPVEQAFGELNTIALYILGITLAFGILLGVAIWATTQRLISPLNLLTNATLQFSRGNWDQRAPVSQEDEIGLLSSTFNQMADDLAITYRSLESQIAERTHSLEKRSQQLEATAQVAREAAAIRNLDELLTYATHLIAEQFNFYHIGIFLLDNPHQYAILQAANSIGGQRMLARGHKLEVGQKGVVGYVAATGYPRIAVDVGSDAFFFDNPDLPETRSELALPLKVRDLVIGVLDVQSTEEAAFEESDIEILQILADQLALAINNTRLFEQSQEFIRELQNAYQGQTRVGWQHRLRNQIKAFHYDRVRVTPASDIHIQTIRETHPQLPQIQNTKNGSVLSVPLRLRDQTIGAILLRRDPNQTPWTSSDLAVVNDAMNQVSAALDNSRLLDETRRTASREQLIGEITTKIRETLDFENIAKTATEEIRKALDLSEVTITIGNDKSDPQIRS